MSVEVVSPDEYTGPVTGDLNRRRGLMKGVSPIAVKLVVNIRKKVYFCLMKDISFEDLDLTTSCMSDLCNFFEESSLEVLGKEVKFVQRKSDITSWLFLQLNTCFIDASKETSLNDLASGLYTNYGIEITKQGLDQRFNSASVKLMKKCFETVFEKILDSNIATNKFSCHFDKVILRDATSFQLPSHMSTFYLGNGCSTTNSVIKIQQEYELLTGKILRLDFRDGVENDVSWLNKFPPKIEENTLYLSDLGYYKLDHLKEINDNSGYFISRYKIRTKLYVKNKLGRYEDLDWEKTISEVLNGSNEGEFLTDFDKDVYIGTGKDRLCVRLHMQKIPEDAVEKRLKRYKTKALSQSKTKKGNKAQVSDFKKELAKLNIFITNAPKEKLEAGAIYEFYRLRWQIELLFKIWKSIFKIDKIGQMNIFRFQCCLYGKLISILIGGHLQTLFKAFMKDKTDFELSEWKAYKIVKKTQENLEMYQKRRYRRFTKIN